MVWTVAFLSSYSSPLTPYSTSKGKQGQAQWGLLRVDDRLRKRGKVAAHMGHITVLAGGVGLGHVCRDGVQWGRRIERLGVLGRKRKPHGR